MNLKVVECEGVEWIHLAQYVVQKPELLNRKIRLRVPDNEGNILLTKRISASQENFCCP